MAFLLDMNYRAVVVAAVVAFVVGAVWYSPLLFGKAYMELLGVNPGAMAEMKPPAGELLGEFIRNLVIAFVLAQFVVRLGVADWKGAVSSASGYGLGFKPCCCWAPSFMRRCR